MAEGGGGNKQTKKIPHSSVDISEECLWVQLESGWSLFFFPFLTTHPSLALWVIIEKKNSVQLFFVSSWQYLQQQQQYFILWKGIPSLFFFSFFDLQKTAIQHNTKKRVKKPKGKTGHKTCKKPTTIAPNLPTTHSEYRLQQNCH